MGKPNRASEGGLVYHVLNRANARTTIFDSDGDYEGYDRFGRIIDQYWEGYGTTPDADRFHYAYDRNSIPTYRDIDSAIYSTNDKDKAYTYDGLDRLKTWDRGTLSGSTISGTPNREQDFTLDQLGNWSNFLIKTSGTTDLDQDRTNNDANEITAITETTGPSWIDPVWCKYSADGCERRELRPNRLLNRRPEWRRLWGYLGRRALMRVLSSRQYPGRQ